MNNIELSIIIITFNNEQYIRECLTSLLKIYSNHEIIIIDNNSTDRTLHIIKNFTNQHSSCNITLIKNRTNRGFARAVNQGIINSKGHHLCLLGSDCRIEENTMEELISFLKHHPEAGLIAPRLVNKFGQTIQSCRRLPTIEDLILELSGLPKLFPGKIKSKWKSVILDRNSPVEVEQPEASCIMTCQKAVQKIGLMDERFTIFFNDVDWCRRFLQNGYKIVYYPQVKVLHYKGGSIYKNRIPMIWKSHQGFYRYFLKYSQNLSQKILIHIIGFILIYTAVLRSIFYILNEPFLKRSRTLN